MRQLKQLLTVLVLFTLFGCGMAPPPSATKSEGKREWSGNDGTGADPDGGKREPSRRKEQPDWRERQKDNPEYKKGEQFLAAKDYSTAIILRAAETGRIATGGLNPYSMVGTSFARRR